MTDDQYNYYSDDIEQTSVQPTVQPTVQPSITSFPGFTSVPQPIEQSNSTSATGVTPVQQPTEQSTSIALAVSPGDTLMEQFSDIIETKSKIVAAEKEGDPRRRIELETLLVELQREKEKNNLLQQQLLTSSN